MKAALHTDQRPQPACPAADPDLPAAAQMHALLRRRIVTGDLRPGMRLSEQDIADQYDLSRQPVREAFIRLAAEGLLEVRPQRGSRAMSRFFSLSLELMNQTVPSSSTSWIAIGRVSPGNCVTSVENMHMRASPAMSLIFWPASAPARSWRG